MKIKISHTFFAIAGLTLIGVTYWKRKSIAMYSKKFLGLREYPGNMGFYNPWFQQKMAAVGWKKGDQWCVYFTKVIWVDKFPKIKNLLLSKISANSQQTFVNFKKDNTGLFKVDEKPKVGDLVIWRYYQNSSATTKGHAGIVTKVSGRSFKTIEGNTSELGATSREGVTIAEKDHSLDEFNPVVSGLRLRGFIRYKYA